MKILVTMAGQGIRFKNAGYSEEKHEILFHGRVLFEWSLLSLKNFFNNDFIFISKDIPGLSSYIFQRSEIMGLRPEKIKVKTLKRYTRGQAETALFAGGFIQSDDSILIYNIDTHVNPEYLRPELIRGNGWMPVFKGEGDRWSFVKADNEGLVTQTTEKVRISDHCSIGLYYFDSFKKFEKLTKTLNDQSKEWYIAPLYNDFIKQGNKVFIHEIPSDKVLVLGTPEDLKNADSKLNGCNDKRQAPDNSDL